MGMTSRSVVAAFTLTFVLGVALGERVEAYNAPGPHWEITGEHTEVCYFLTNGTIDRGFTHGVRNADFKWDWAGADFSFKHGNKAACPYTVREMLNGTMKVGASYWDWTGTRGPAIPSGHLMAAWCNSWASGATGETLLSRCFTRIDYGKYTWEDAAPGTTKDCFDTANRRPRVDPWSIAIHEFGHWLLLGDVSSGTPVMTARYDVCTSSGKMNIRHELTTDDKNGIKHIY